jgi:2-amino-4-hydroxy-6-hydroxymethyldihydropteridine diphosphokinase
LIRSFMNTRALIGLGSNLGDRKTHLDTALAGLDETPGIRVRRVSSYHATAPVGGPTGQGAYLNASAVLETRLAPIDLLHVLQDLERRAGRVRTVRWGERPIDLDLLLFGDQVIEIGSVGAAPELVVPHPRMTTRRFVLAPSAEVAPDALEPWTGKTITALLANVDRRPSYVAIHDPARQFGVDLFRRLVGELSAVAISAEADLLDHEGDRWLVSDFWFDANETTRDLVEENLGDVRGQPVSGPDRGLAPTFVVAPPGTRATHSVFSESWRRRTRRGDVPILEVEPGNLDAVAGDVLAACAATRASMARTASIADPNRSPL